MKQALLLHLFTFTLLLSGCVEDDPAPKCTTKAISYQEFKAYQESQNSWSNTDTLEKDNK
jgi:hypothetical protein